ncbi:hypothetical protein FB451DRAFT_1564378 [Mycena latifolia]|nr:hypothetical protein FB451DRAFT_1564378 [Mycena latifolia]
MDGKLRSIILRAIASPTFVFRFDLIDSYWATIATSTKLWVRDALEHVGDGRIAPCVFSLLATRWAGEPVKLLKMVCQTLVSNLVFSAILMSVGAYRGRIRNSDDVKNVADNFEAYVAAYARQFGTKRLKSWVFRAFGPLVDSIHSSCSAAFLSPVLVRPPTAPTQSARTNDIEVALTRLVLAMPKAPRRTPTAPQAKAQHANNNETAQQVIFVEIPPTPTKRKATDENAPPPSENARSSKKAKLQTGLSTHPHQQSLTFLDASVVIPTVLGDRTNKQGSRRTSASTERSTRQAKPQSSDAPPALLQRMSDPTPPPAFPPTLDPAPALLQRMQTPSTFAEYRLSLASHALSPQYSYTMPHNPEGTSWERLPQTHPAVAAFSSSPHMPWWTYSGVFASAMQDIGAPLPSRCK